MTDQRPTDVLLWRARLEGHGVPQRLSLTGGLRPACVAWSLSEALVHVYARLPIREFVDLDNLSSRFSLNVDGAPAANVPLCRLESVLDLPGASHAAMPEAHYVVETASDPGWMDEIARWYADEHLPGLAAVAGCVAARRYINHDDVRCSLACYDLVGADVLRSPAWLAVRETEWSSRTRPHFTHTTRTMFANITETSR